MIGTISPLQGIRPVHNVPDAEDLRRQIDDNFQRVVDGHNRLRTEVNRHAPHVFNLKAWGAKGNDITDDTNAITATITAAGIVGGVVYAPTGIYKHGDLGPIPSNVAIVGDGKYATTFHLKDSADCHSFYVEAGADTTNCRFAHFGIDGNGANQASNGDGIHLDNTGGTSTLISRHVVQDVYIVSTFGSGIYHGIFVRNLNVDNVDIYSCGANGIQCSGSADSRFHNIDIGRSGNDGFFINGCGALQLSHVKTWFSGQVTAGSAGFRIRNSNIIRLGNCISQENAGHGYLLSPSTGTQYGIVLSGCISDGDNTDGGSFYGCLLNNGSYCRIDLTVAKTTTIGTPVRGITIQGSNTANCEVTLVTDTNITGTAVGGDAAVGRCAIRLNGRDGAALTPSQITANQNNYAPTGNYDYGIWRLSSDASRNITGITALFAGARLTLVNVGSNNIVLKNASGSSSAANQFLFAAGADITLTANDSLVLYYDGTSTVWRDAVVAATVGDLHATGSLTVDGSITGGGGAVVVDSGTAKITLDGTDGTVASGTVGIMENGGILSASSRGGVAVLLDNDNGDTTQQFAVYHDGTTPGGSSQVFAAKESGTVVCGALSALATDATDGFVYIPTCAGTPTGTPTTASGKVPLVFDTTNRRLYVYESSAWHYFGETA